MSWKEHPTGIAVTAFAATLTFCVTVVIPIWDKEKDNEIASLKREPTALKAELDKLKAQIELIESENQKLRRDLDRVDPTSLFSTDNVYPRGFREVRIGDRISLLAKVYEGRGSIQDEDDWVSVELKSPGMFTRVTYYYDKDAPVKTVTHVLFHFNGPFSETFKTLKQALIEKYGQLQMKENKDKTTPASWENVAGGYTVELQTVAYHIIKR